MLLARSPSDEKIIDTSHLVGREDSERRWQSLCIVVANVFFVAGMETDDEGAAECEDSDDYEDWDQVGKRLAGIFADAKDEATAELEVFVNDEEWHKVGKRLAGVFAESSAKLFADAEDDS